jgi:hypothetical protein
VTPALGTSGSQYDCVSNIKTNCAKFFLLKSINGLFYSVGNLTTGHFSEKLLFEGHSSVHTGSNDTGLEFLSYRGAEKKGGQLHRQTDRRTDFGYYYIARRISLLFAI